MNKPRKMAAHRVVCIRAEEASSSVIGGMHARPLLRATCLLFVLELSFQGCLVYKH